MDRSSVIPSVQTVAVHAADPERVRARTNPEVNARIDRRTRESIAAAAADGAIAERMQALDKEWDFERILEAEAAVTGLTGLLLAVTVDKRFLFIPGFATAMMLVHAIHGWYPLLPILRRAGIRTEDEIAREKYALKSLRGDFDPVKTADAERRAEAAWRAVLA